jgi:hypothetical protein
MCYEFSHWFERARAKELHKAREKMDTQQRASPPAPAREPERAREEVKETEKTPA